MTPYDEGLEQRKKWAQQGMSKWVQHRSGDGEKWEVSLELERMWRCNPGPNQDWVYLPKSEYVECAPPEMRWVNATDEFKVSESGGNLICKMDGTRLSSKNDGYRLRKVEIYRSHPGFNQNCLQQAFIVEKRQP